MYLPPCALLRLNDGLGLCIGRVATSRHIDSVSPSHEAPRAHGPECVPPPGWPEQVRGGRLGGGRLAPGQGCARGETGFGGCVRGGTHDNGL